MSPAEDSKCIYATEMQKMRIFNKYILFSTYAIGWRGGGVEGWRGGGVEGENILFRNQKIYSRKL
jgi:hypothetical protein